MLNKHTTDTILYKNIKIKHWKYNLNIKKDKIIIVFFFNALGNLSIYLVNMMF